jgi:hypothetical protein
MPKETHTGGILMSPEARMEYLETIIDRYRTASRKQKAAILDEFCRNCSYNRKYAIYLLSNFKRYTKKKPRKRGRTSKYNLPEVLKPLKRIWETANLPCSKRLKAILPQWLGFYHKEYDRLAPETIQLLLKISAPTIDRILQPSRAKYKNKGRCTTKPGTLLKMHIPVKTDQWDEKRPGFLEADTVALCGNRLEGDFAFIVDYTDIATGWTEQRAVWGKGETGVLKQTKDMEARLPFKLLGFDCDNGSEFLNWHLLRHFTDRQNAVQFTRSRPYKKNDNAHIEQKNWTQVRQWLGYSRFDNPDVIPMLNNLFCNEWRLFLNFFLPSTKLISKMQLAAKTVKCYDAPKTPYLRVLDSSFVSSSAKRSLKDQYDKLNPFLLRKVIDEKLKKIFAVASLSVT